MLTSAARAKFLFSLHKLLYPVNCGSSGGGLIAAKEVFLNSFFSFPAYLQVQADFFFLFFAVF